MIFSTTKKNELYYQTLQQISKIQFSGLEQYASDRLLAVQTWNYYTEKYESHRLIRIFWKCFSKGYIYFFKEKKGRILFFYSHVHSDRSDYFDFFSKVASCTKDSFIVKGIPQKLSISFLFFRNIYYVYKWKKALSPLKVDRVYEEMILLTLLRCINWQDIIRSNEKKLSQYSGVVTVFDVLPEEYLLVSFFKKLNLPSATLQHGHFMKKKWISNDSFTTGFAFHFSPSDYFLAWGELTKQYAIESGMEAKRIKLTGCPKFIDYVPVERNEDPRSEKVFGLLLEGGNGTIIERLNTEMIRICIHFAQKNGLKLIIKKHPSWSIDYTMNEIVPFQDIVEIADNGMSIIDFSNKVSFSISSSSSVYAELLIIQSIVFRFTAPYFIDRYSGIEYGEFHNEDELQSYYNELTLNRDSVIDKMKHNSDTISPTTGIRERYERFFKSCYKSQQ